MILLLLVIAVVLVIALSWKGVDIDLSNKLFRPYTSYMGVKSGKWKSFAGYAYLSVLATREAQSFQSRGNASFTTKSKYYDLYLLNEDHRKKSFVRRFPTREEAMVFAMNLSRDMGLKMAKYNPVVSEKTAQRRKMERNRK